MDKAVRWSLIVSQDTDISLRTFLAQRGMRKGDLSKFVEDAVRWRVLDQCALEVKEKNKNIPPEELEKAIDEAIQSIRAGYAK